jgi:hypothetical protein
MRDNAVMLASTQISITMFLQPRMWILFTEVSLTFHDPHFSVNRVNGLLPKYPCILRYVPHKTAGLCRI